MRSILMASAAILIAGTAPGMARDYPWCARTIINPDFGDCSFTSYGQCMATVSGQAGECIYNQRFAYGRTPRGRRNAREAHDYDFWRDGPNHWNDWQ